jgi:hypothetical protein
LFESTGLREVEATALFASVEHPSFDEWWDRFTLGVGPAGEYVTTLEPERRARLRADCRERFPDGPFLVEARAWAARGLA